jgi:GTPase SAR1 family protein
METKDFILIVVSILTLATGIAGFIFGIIQYKKRKRGKKSAKQKDISRQRINEKKYCEHINRKFKYLDFTGLNAILQKPLLLEKIYVKRRIKEYDEDFIRAFENLYEKYIKVGESLKLVILGQPGSGKTTLMKWIALQCGSTKNFAFSRFIPVYISLKELAWHPGKTFRIKNIRDLAVEWLEKENIPSTIIDNAFAGDKLLLLLDGLDEVEEETIRKEVIQWIENQNIGQNVLLVTSRLPGIKESRGIKFHDAIPIFTIQDFDIADIERFLENWYKNIEVAVVSDESKEGTEQAIKKGKIQYEDLMNIIKDESYENLRHLAVNPLLLTIIAIAHRTRAVMPKERHKLYEECLKVMIELWNVANKKLDIGFSVENSMDNLSKIAVFIMKENRREIELSEIKTILPKDIEGKPLDFFLKEMVLKTGLLNEANQRFGIVYRAFLEYLAAYYYASGENQNKILEYRDNDSWMETFKLFVNIGNVRFFFNEIISNLFEFEKNYWWYMPLWNECLEALVDDKTRKEIEIKFAKKILEFIPMPGKDKWNFYSETDLLNYFSNLSQQELKEFQYNNPGFIASELSGGNFKVLGEPSILSETLDKAEKCVEFNIDTIEKLLHFKVNFEDQKQNILPLRAFLVLKRADYKKLRELILHITQFHKDERMRINALYVFKKIN